MSINQLKAKHVALINMLEQGTPLWKAEAYILRTIPQCKTKAQLIRTFEVDAHYAQDVFRYVLNTSVYDLKH